MEPIIPENTLIQLFNQKQKRLFSKGLKSAAAPEDISAVELLV